MGISKPMKTIAFKLPDPAHNIRGVGFYAQRLLSSMNDISQSHGIKIKTFYSVPPENSDLVHYPNFDLFKNSLPIHNKHRTVVSILDVIPLEYPLIYPAGIKGKINLRLQKMALNSVSQIITISEHSKNQIVKYLNIAADKITVTVLAPDPAFKKISDSRKLEILRKKYGLSQKFVLYVGDINWNKNLSLLIDSCEKAKVQLVIVGKQALEIDNLSIPISHGPRDKIRKILGKTHPELQHLNKLSTLFQKKHVKRLGFISTQELAGIYNLATAYCQPSIVEGFGLPLLEAMACGTPSISSNTSSLPEIGGDAVAYFDPNDEEMLTNKIKNIISQEKLAQNLSIKALEQSKFFTWNQTAALTIDTYLKYI